MEKRWSLTFRKISHKKLWQSQCLPPRKVTERKGGHPKARAEEAQHVHSSTMTKREESEKDRNDTERPSPPNRRQPCPTPEVSNNRTGTSPSGRDYRPPCDSYEKGSCRRPKKDIATTGTLRSAYLTKEVNAEQASSVASSISRKMTEGQSDTSTERRQSKRLKRDRKTGKHGEKLSAGV